MGDMRELGLTVRVLLAIGVAGGLAASSYMSGRQDESVQRSLDQIEDLDKEFGVTIEEEDKRISLSDRELNECMDESEFDFMKTLGAGQESESERLKLMRALYGCEPNLDQIDQIVFGITSILQAAAGESVTITVDEGRCVVRHIVDNSDDPPFTMAVAERPEDLVAFLAAVEACLPTDKYEVAIGATGAMHYGDDEHLDLLYDGCESGDMRLCDILFWNAAPDSDYYNLTYECAGHTPATETSCSPEGEVDMATMLAPPDSLYPQQLSDECIAGDMAACDLLFYITPLDSDFNDTGYTCGNRIGIGAIPDCRTRLGDNP